MLIVYAAGYGRSSVGPVDVTAGLGIIGVMVLVTAAAELVGSAWNGAGVSSRVGSRAGSAENSSGAEKFKIGSRVKLGKGVIVDVITGVGVPLGSTAVAVCVGAGVGGGSPWQAARLRTKRIQNPFIQYRRPVKRLILPVITLKYTFNTGIMNQDERSQITVVPIG